MQSQRYPVIIAVTGTVFTLTGFRDIDRGWLQEIDIEVPDYTNTVTTTPSLVRANGTITWTGSAINKNTKSAKFTDSPDMRWLEQNDTLTFTLSGAAGGTVPYTLYVTLHIMK